MTVEGLRTVWPQARDLNGFALVKAEHRKQACDREAPWQLVWEAGPWPSLD